MRQQSLFPREPFSADLIIRVTRKDHDALKRAAARKGVSVSAFVRALIRPAIGLAAAFVLGACGGELGPLEPPPAPDACAWVCPDDAAGCVVAVKECDP